MPIEYDHNHEQEITLFAETNFRNERRRFGIKTDDRRRHMYIIGKTGMGKTTLMENLILQDIKNGHGCCYIDPHGDTAEGILDFIPANRINDVVYFNPADTAYPVGFNILETENDDQKPLVASGLMGVFKKIWPDVWSPRMEYILMNCVLALLDYPGATLLGINRLLVDKEYRARVVAKIRDPIVKTFWVAEFTSWSEKYATEAIAPVQNKVGQFLSSSIIRNMVAQVRSTINLRRIMDDGKILIANLSKGRIGEDNMRLLGGMLVTKLQLAAQERQNIPITERRDFYLFVDEFQNFANESFASILSEARKYCLNLIVAHQYIEQLDEKVTPAIFGNVGTIIVMRVGAADAEAMETEFTPVILPEDLVNLTKYQMYLKLMVDGVATPPFSANALAPISKRAGNMDKVIAVSRERYAEPKAVIEEKVLKWSGMETSPQTLEDTASSASAPVISSVTEEQGGPLQPEGSRAVPSSPVVSPAVEYPAIRTQDELEAITSDEYLRITPERMASITASVGQKGFKSAKPKFVHTCQRCGKQFELAIQLDPSKPIYDPECRAIVLEERKQRGTQMRYIKRAPVLPEASAAAETSESSFAPTNVISSEPKLNRPRLIHDARVPNTGEERQAPEAEEEDLLTSILKTKDENVELRKKTLERRAGEAIKPEDAEGAQRKRRRRKRGGERSDGPGPIAASSNPNPNPNPQPKPLAPGERISFDL